MPTYLCSRNSKGADSKRIDEYGEFIKLFHEFADKETDEILRFEFSKRYFLEIGHARREGFYVNCIHESHSFETMIPYDGVKTGFTVEEFLEDFWHHRVRQKYNFDEVVEMRNPDFTMKFRFPFRTFLPVLFFLLPFVFSWMNHKPIDVQTYRKMFLFILTGTSAYWILTFQYLFYSWNATISISNKEKLVMLKKGNHETVIRFSEITQVRIIRNRSSPFIAQWGYMRIVAGPRERIIIPDLLYQELERVANILGKEAIFEPSFYPLIRLKKKSTEDVAEEEQDREEKTKEFVSKWSGKTKEELQLIVNSKDEYADYAVDAAKQLLKTKK